MTSNTRDTLAQAAVQFCSLILSLLTTVMLARSLTTEQFGQYQLLVSTLALAEIAALPGFYVVLLKAAAKGKERFYLDYLKLGVSSVVTLSILVVAAFFLTDPVNLLNLSLISVVLLCSGALLAVLRGYEPVLLGLNNFFLHRCFGIALPLLIASSIGIGTLFLQTPEHFFVVLICAKAAIALAGCIIVVRHLNVHKPLQRTVKNYFLRYGLKQTIFTGIMILVGRVDRIILGLLNPVDLAIYSIGLILPDRFNAQLKALLAIITSAWSRLPRAANRRKLQDSGIGLTLLGLLIYGIVATGIWQLTVPLFGEEFSSAVKVGLVYSLTLFGSPRFLFFAAYHHSQNDGAVMRKIQLIKAAFHVVVLFILIEQFGMIGAAWAQVASTYFLYLMAYIFSRKQ